MVAGQEITVAQMTERTTVLNAEKRTRRAKEVRQPGASWRSQSTCRAKGGSLPRLLRSGSEDIWPEIITRHAGQFLDLQHALGGNNLPLNHRLRR
jgi:hypothetical protein